jgi:alternate signal-mediated exported protein
MNKLVKGSIAGAAGIALLLGGAGTLALWNDSADIADTTINSGTLTLTESATSPAWTGPSTIVPGDTVTYDSQVTVTAAGDNINATLSVDESSITGGDAELLADLDIAMTADLTGLTGIAAGTAAGTYDITAPGTYVIPVSVTVVFDELSDNDTKSQSVDLTGLAFDLQQYLLP